MVTVRGRTIVVRQLLDAQMLFLTREAHLLQQENVTPARKVAGIRRVFDALESQVVQEADKDYLMDQIAAGNLEFKELMGFVEAFQDTVEVEPEKPKVRRGRRPAVH